MQKEEVPQLNRSLVADVGTSLYHFPGVKSVHILVEFDDGTGLNFGRSKEHEHQ